MLTELIIQKDNLTIAFNINEIISIAQEATSSCLQTIETLVNSEVPSFDFNVIFQQIVTEFEMLIEQAESNKFNENVYLLSMLAQFLDTTGNPEIQLNLIAAIRNNKIKSSKDLLEFLQDYISPQKINEFFQTLEQIQLVPQFSKLTECDVSEQFEVILKNVIYLIRELDTYENVFSTQLPFPTLNHPAQWLKIASKNGRNPSDVKKTDPYNFYKVAGRVLSQRLQNNYISDEGTSFSFNLHNSLFSFFTNKMIDFPKVMDDTVSIIRATPQGVPPSQWVPYLEEKIAPFKDRECQSPEEGLQILINEGLPLVIPMMLGLVEEFEGKPLDMAELEDSKRDVLSALGVQNSKAHLSANAFERAAKKKEKASSPLERQITALLKTLSAPQFSAIKLKIESILERGNLVEEVFVYFFLKKLLILSGNNQVLFGDVKSSLNPSYPQILEEFLKTQYDDKEIIALMRKILQGEDIANIPESIPTLITIWFIAETARNPLSFLSSLIMLDLMENDISYGKQKNYTWRNVLWHQEGNSNGSLTSADRKGGKHPMAHFGSFYEVIFEDISNQIKKIEELIATGIFSLPDINNQLDYLKNTLFDLACAIKKEHMKRAWRELPQEITKNDIDRIASNNTYDLPSNNFLKDKKNSNQEKLSKLFGSFEKIKSDFNILKKSFYLHEDEQLSTFRKKEGTLFIRWLSGYLTDKVPCLGLFVKKASEQNPVNITNEQEILFRQEIKKLLYESFVERLNSFDHFKLSKSVFWATLHVGKQKQKDDENTPCIAHLLAERMKYTGVAGSTSSSTEDRGSTFSAPGDNTTEKSQATNSFQI